jgi:hypothetical protein
MKHLIWKDLLQSVCLDTRATVVEVAPGYKSKIGHGLADFGFCGTIYLVEPNQHAAESVARDYIQLLPNASVRLIQKPLDQIDRVFDIPEKIDAIVANHALDDMALRHSIREKDAEVFFNLNSGPDRITQTKRLWESIPHHTLQSSVQKTTRDWVRFINRFKPRLVMLSQYKGNTLQSNNIYLPDEIGLKALEALKKYFDAELMEPQKSILNLKGFEDRWLIKSFDTADLLIEIDKKPRAITRLHPSIFVREKARKLAPKEYHVVYTNNSLLKRLGYISTAETQENTNKIIGDAFAYIIEPEVKKGAVYKTVYADRQADPTDIALSGNCGSGRACYVGSDFNIKGIGKTQLVGKPKDPIHGTGKLDIVTALREALMTEYICKHTESGSSPVLAVIALTDKIKMPWKKDIIRTALLVRLDRGTLDRPSHLAYTNLQREIMLPELIKRYARLDAEMFGKKILHGAWSTGNVSLGGHLLDIESVSITSGRGPRHNITKKYISNYFGYESLGFKQILEQLSHMLGADYKECVAMYDEERARHMTEVLLLLLGVSKEKVPEIVKAFPRVHSLAKQFELLAKKASPRRANLITFGNKEQGTHVLDFSKHFKCMPLCELGLLLKKKEFAHCKTEIYKPENPAEQYLKKHVIIDKNNVKIFLKQTRQFLKDLAHLIEGLKKHSFVPPTNIWRQQLHDKNKGVPSFATLTETIEKEVDAFERDMITAKKLTARINRLGKTFL